VAAESAPAPDRAKADHQALKIAPSTRYVKGPESDVHMSEMVENPGFNRADMPNSACNISLMCPTNRSHVRPREEHPASTSRTFDGHLADNEAPYIRLRNGRKPWLGRVDIKCPTFWHSRRRQIGRRTTIGVPQAWTEGYALPRSIGRLILLWAAQQLTSRQRKLAVAERFFLAANVGRNRAPRRFRQCGFDAPNLTAPQ
jgi:hypothetical protein